MLLVHKNLTWRGPQTHGLLQTLFGLVFLISYWIHASQAAAVMSVDLGSEWMKVGVVSPGVPMEIALNKESKRKTPAILSFRNGERTFGEDAVTVGIRDPAAAYGYLMDLLGKTIDNPIVELYRKRFPYYELVADANRNTIIFKKSETEEFSVEELIAQMLLKAKEFAQESTNQAITECVLTVPGYFGQAERHALLSAAQLANLKVLQLMNDYTAVALNYGVFHRAEFNETAQYVMFYDMGAYKTSAALVSYQLRKDKQTKELNPVIQVLGVGYDRTLGGLEIQLRLRDYLAAEFNALKKTTTDVTKSPRALAKLFKEAGRLKNVLSANNDHYAQIENLLEDHDFKLQVTREKLEELCEDLWPRITKPLEQALALSGLTLDVVSQVIIFGGGTRVPRVQEILKNAIGKELGKSLNADEAATMGAVYKAADLATGFKVKKFIVKDAVLFPIQVSFERDPGDGGSVKQIKRMLFGPMNSYPQKKLVSFNKHTDDFDFYVHYGDLSHLSAEEVLHLGSLNLSHVELQQVKELFEKTQNDVVDSKGIKAHFSVDDSGIFHLTSVEYTFDKQVKDEDEGTFAKLGSTISKLFSKDSENIDPQNSTKDDESEEKTNEQDVESKLNENSTIDEAPNTTTDEKVKPLIPTNVVKTAIVREPVPHKLTVQFTKPLSGENLQKSADKLTSINSAEYERNRLQSSFNSLESHVIETQQKLQEDEYATCVSTEEKQKILDECAALSEWLYEDSENPTAELYEKRLADLKALTNVYLSRHWEHEERPEALKSLKGMIDSAKKFLNTARNMTKGNNPEKDIFTEVELDTLQKLLDDTVEWRKVETANQKKLKRHEDVRLTVKLIYDKMSSIEREINYLVNKMKIWKPKPKPTNKDKSKDRSDEASKDELKSETVGESSGKDKEDKENIDIPQSEDKEEKQDIPQSDEHEEKPDMSQSEAKEEEKSKIEPEAESTPRTDL